MCTELSGVVNVPGELGGTPLGANNCWTIAVDLEGYEFNLEGDGGSCSPGNQSVDTDSFGWSYNFVTPAGGTTVRGMAIAGDPATTTSATGAHLHGGSGTYYGRPAPWGATPDSTPRIYSSR